MASALNLHGCGVQSLAVYIIDRGRGNLYYVHKDHLGSLYALTDDVGQIATYKDQLQVFSFDPWGRRRNPFDWTFTGVTSDYLVKRGFTGHEHLDRFGLINMNGRMYDPLVGRFLSPDNYVQAPDNSQSFNRYSYCLNNPLVYTDPDGEFIFTALCMIIPGAQFLLPVAISADIGAVTGGLDAALWGNDIGQGMIYGAAIGGAFAAGQLTIESIKNYNQGYGFGTNVGRFNYLVRNTQEAHEMRNINDFNNAFSRLNAFGSSRFGFNPNASFIESGSSSTDLFGQFGISFYYRTNTGDLIRRSGASIRRSYVHESDHLKNIFYHRAVFDKDKGKFLDPEPYFFRGNDLWTPTNNLGGLENHGTVGYFKAIEMSGKFHLRILEKIAPGTKIAWQQYGLKKYYYAIPRRF